MALGKIKADTLEHSTAGSVDTQYVVGGSAKVWANINQSGNAVRGTHGLSGMTDNGAGDVSINFSNAFDSTDNYAVNGTTGSNGSAPDHYVTGPDSNRTYSTSTVGLNLMNFNGSINDQAVLWITVHGDLA